MNTRRTPAGKILLHGAGAGAITEHDVERRARELSAIDGRPPAEQVEAKYFAQARRELTGENLPPATADDPPPATEVSRDPAEPPSDSGLQIPDQEDVDEQQDVERLAEEGVEEAQHEQMLAARRHARKADRRDA